MQEPNQAPNIQQEPTVPPAPDVPATPVLEPSLPPEAPVEAMIADTESGPAEAPTGVVSPLSPEVTLADSANAAQNVVEGGITPPPGPIPAPPEVPQGNGFDTNVGPSNVTSQSPEQAQLNQDIMGAAAQAAAEASANSVNPAPQMTAESPIGPPPAAPEQSVPAQDATPPVAGTPPAA